MELRDLRALVAVVRAGSFTAAAAELGYTQSAVSQQVAGLEAELGQRLLERRPVRPTPAGARLAEHAVRILMRADVARSELAHREGTGIVLRIDAVPLAAPAELAAALARLRRSHPALRATVRATDPAAALAGLASGWADLALVDGVGAPDNPLALAEPGLFSTTALAEEPLVVALPRGHPLAGRAGIDLTMLADAPWVAAPRLPPGAGLALAPGQVVCRETDLLGTLAFVAANHGCALLPASLPLTFPGVSVVPLREPRLVQRVEMMTRHHPAGLAARLVDELRSHARLS